MESDTKNPTEALRNVEHYQKEFKLYDGFKADLIECQYPTINRGACHDDGKGNY